MRPHQQRRQCLPGEPRPEDQAVHEDWRPRAQHPPGRPSQHRQVSPNLTDKK